MPVFTNLKQLKYLLAFVGFAFLSFDISYFLMSVLPGTRDKMCMMGANLTPVNIGFSLVLSMMIGLMFAGFVKLFADNFTKNKMALTSLSGISFIIGTLSVICPACTLPVISLFGMTIWIDFLSDHDVMFKIVSLLMMAGSLYYLNRQLNNTCTFCATKSVPVE